MKDSAGRSRSLPLRAWSVAAGGRNVADNTFLRTAEIYMP
jgi:hypothetical protein